MKSIALLLAVVATVSPIAAQNQDATFSSALGNYVRVPSSSTLTPPNGITVEAWVWYDSSSVLPTWTPTIVRKNPGVLQDEYLLRVENNGVLRWRVKVSGFPTYVDIYSPMPLPTHVWTHVAGSYNSISQLYINGIQVAASAILPAYIPMAGGNGELRIGKGGDVPGEMWNGRIDEVRIWNSPRSAAQIQATMHWQVSSALGLVSAWRLNGNAVDSIGPNQGTLIGAVTFGASSLALTTGVSPYQVNQPAMNLEVDGTTPITEVSACDGFVPVKRAATAPGCVPATFTLGVWPTAPNPWNLGYTLEPGVPATVGGPVTSAGQVVNLNLASPTFQMLYPTFGPGAATYTSIPVSVTPQFVGSVQGVALNPMSPDGFTLSQMLEIHAISSAPVLTAPADDVAVTIQLSSPLLCGAPATIPFFNAQYSQFDVSSNGRIIFGSPMPNGSPGAAVSSAIASYPFVGAWCDLVTTPNHPVTVSVPSPGVVRVSWRIAVYKSASASVSFGIQIDGATGVIEIDSLGGILPSSPGVNQFLGISAGILGPATDGGPTAFVSGGATPANGLDMIYAYGPAGTLSPFLSTLIFYPTPSTGGYGWTAY